MTRTPARGARGNHLDLDNRQAACNEYTAAIRGTLLEALGRGDEASAERLAARGVEVPTIQSLAGHAYLVTTQRYLHATPGAADAAIAALEADGPSPVQTHGTAAAPAGAQTRKQPRR